jgi:hypothetical protein
MMKTMFGMTSGRLSDRSMFQALSVSGLNVSGGSAGAYAATYIAATLLPKQFSVSTVVQLEAFTLPEPKGGTGWPRIELRPS